MNRILVSLLAVLTGIVLVSSCNKTQNKANSTANGYEIASQDSIFDLIMVVHDEVMPLTSTLAKRRTQLQKVTEPDQVQTDLLSQLSESEKAMWDWMYAVKGPNTLRDSLSHEDIIQYLITEQSSIDNIKTMMTEAVKNSDQLYEN